MHCLIFALTVVLSIPAAFAEDAASTMTRDELLAFLPNKHVKHMHKNGSLRRWVNEPSGQLVASSDNKHFGSMTGSQSGTGVGNWQVDNEGRYCVNINWKRVDEKWCVSILKSPEGSYYMNQADDAHRIEFTSP